MGEITVFKSLKGYSLQKIEETLLQRLGPDPVGRSGKETKFSEGIEEHSAAW